MSDIKDEHRYDHILNMPYKKSMKRRHMSMNERAAQFGAFRALTGYEEAVTETGRLTDLRIELDEYKKSELDTILRNLALNTDSMPRVTVTHFVPDTKKEGGEYVTKTGILYRIREFEKQLVFADGEVININDIILIEEKE